MKNNCACDHAKCNKTAKGKMCPKHGMEDCMITEEGLRNWFGSSKSKDGKGGWVNVVTGGTCASDEPGEGVPKCVSSAKRASMTKAERRSAAARKKTQDPGQQSKSGAAAPTNVSTDKPKKKKKMNEESDAKGKGSGTKDACYHKVKSRYDVWPSAYASGALVKCRKAGAKNWGNKSESLSLDVTSEACWSGYTAKGLKKKGDKLVPNCVKEVLENLKITESTKVIRSVGQTYSIILTYRAKTLNIKFFFPSQQRPTKQEVQIAIEKIYPGAILQYYAPTVNDPTGPFIVVDEAAAWQRKEANTHITNEGALGWAALAAGASALPYLVKKFAGPTINKALDNTSSPTGAAQRVVTSANKQTQSTVDAINQVTPGSASITYPGRKKLGEEIAKESAAWQRKEGKNPEGGLNAKGIASYRKENPGSKLSMAVTTPPSKLKPGSKAANRRKSFCARMGGVDGPMKDEKGRPTRKALALKKWNC